MSNWFSVFVYIFECNFNFENSIQSDKICKSVWHSQVLFRNNFSVRKISYWITNTHKKIYVNQKANRNSFYMTTRVRGIGEENYKIFWAAQLLI